MHIRGGGHHPHIPHASRTSATSPKRLITESPRPADPQGAPSGTRLFGNYIREIRGLNPPGNYARRKECGREYFRIQVCRSRVRKRKTAAFAKPGNAAAVGVEHRPLGDVVAVTPVNHGLCGGSRALDADQPPAIGQLRTQCRRLDLDAALDQDRVIGAVRPCSRRRGGPATSTHIGYAGRSKSALAFASRSGVLFERDHLAAQASPSPRAA